MRFQVFVVRRTPCTQALEPTLLVYLCYHKRSSPILLNPSWGYDILEHSGVLSHSIRFCLEFFFIVLLPLSHLRLRRVPSTELVQFLLSPDRFLRIRLRRRRLPFVFMIEECQEHCSLPASQHHERTDPCC